MVVKITLNKEIQDLVLKLSEGKFSLVLERSGRLINEHPDTEILYILKGAACQSLQQYANAIKSYQQAIDINADNVNAYNNLGIVFDVTKDFISAIKNFELAIKLSPNFPEAHYNLGNVYRKLNNFEAAIASYTFALEGRHNFAEALCNKGSCLSSLGDETAAVDCFQKAIKINSDYIEAHNNMSVSLKNIGNFSSAKISAQKAIDLFPNYASAHNNLGNSNLALGQINLAVGNYEAAVKIDPNLPKVFSNLANALLQKGDKISALENYKNALEANPSDAQAEHFINVLTAPNTPSAPMKYVEELFNSYAMHFEQSLVNKLNYNFPDQLAKILMQRIGTNSLGAVLDLGCGTGLVGMKINQICSQIVGVDVSKAMLNEAIKKDTYFRLERSDIIDYLLLAELKFDYFIAADVFNYIGDLTEVFHLIKKRNKRSGYLAFSTEHTDTKTYQLNTTGRYTHSKKYIEDLCLEYSYDLTHFSKVNLRKEGESFVTGGVYILAF